MTTEARSGTVIQLELPEAFGTNTLHGMFYELAAPAGAIRPAEEVLREILDLPIFLKIGFRTPKKLAFIAEETLGFVEWSKKNFGIEPKITFV